MRILLKIGGAMLKNTEILDKIAQDISKFKGKHQFVIVHGGGPNISELMEKFGKSPKFIDGLRYTDEETMEIVQLALVGLTNVNLVSLFNKNCCRSVGLNGFDDNLILAKKKQKIDLGYVGEVEKINTKLIENMFENDITPIIASVSTSKDNYALNVNADEAASAIAARLKCDLFILLSNVDGVLRDIEDKSSIIDQIKVDQAKNLIKNKEISGGMIPKLGACIEAVEGGVSRSLILGENNIKLGDIIKGQKIGTNIYK